MRGGGSPGYGGTCAGRVGCGRARAALAALLLLALTAILNVGAARAQTGQAAEAEVFVANAIVAYGEQRYQDAKAALDEALRLDPGNVNALYYTGLVDIALQRFADAAVALERARQLAPGDPSIAFQLGALYFGLGRYDEAQPLLEEAFRANPTADSLGYYVGFMRYRQKDYQGALRAFRAGATTDPDVEQLTRFYSGLALGAIGLPREAAAALDEALRVQPVSPLTGPAERLRGSVVAAAGQPRRFRAQVRFGFLYDTNVTVLPDVSSDPIVQALRQGDKESSGEVGAARVDYSFIRQGGFEAIATVSVFGIYYNRISDFSLLNPLGGIGLTYRGTVGALPFQLGLQYAYDFFLLGTDPFVQRNTIVPSAAVAWNSWNLSVVEGRVQTEYFYDQGPIPPQENRNGVDYMVGLSHVMQLWSGRIQARLGYQFDYDKTDGSNYEYVGNRVLAGVQYTLPWYGITVSDNFDVHLRNYTNTNTVFPTTAPGTVQRFDTQYTNVVGIGLPLPHNLALNLDWQLIIQNSNIAVFAYNRNVVSLIMTWTY